MVMGLLLVAGGSWGATVGLDQGWVGQWLPGIGDPTPIGWVTAVAYLVAAGLCFAALPGVGRWRRDPKLVRKERILWWVLGLLLVFLGLNKQLDLQTAFTELARMLARDEGWYAKRRTFQEGFILAIVLWTGLGLGGLFYLTFRLSPWTRVAAAGTCLVAAYVIIRAASFHNVDLFIMSQVGGLRVNWIFELGGILIIIAAAGLRLRQLRPKAK